MTLLSFQAMVLMLFETMVPYLSSAMDLKLIEAMGHYLCEVWVCCRLKLHSL